MLGTRINSRFDPFFKSARTEVHDVKREIIFRLGNSVGAPFFPSYWPQYLPAHPPIKFHVSMTIQQKGAQLGRPGAVSSSLSSARMKRTRAHPADKGTIEIPAETFVTERSKVGKQIVSRCDSFLDSDRAAA